MNRHMQPVMLNKRETMESKEDELFMRRIEARCQSGYYKRKQEKTEQDESFMRRVEARRQSGYYKRKREKTERIKREKDYNGREAIIIPDIIVSMILTRLPVKTLVRFRSVCKNWREATYDPWFISLHLEQSKKNPVLVIAPLNPGKQTDISLYRFDNIDENINKSLKTANLMFKHDFGETLHVLDTPLHANGLILLGSPSSLVVCNPCTRECIKLPNGHHTAPCTLFTNYNYNNYSLYQYRKPCGRAALCYVSSSNSYKVVQYFYRDIINSEGYHDRVGLEIMTLGGKKECLRWEVASEDAPYPIDCYACPKAVGGAVYFKIDNSIRRSTPKAILSYNLKDEKYRVVDLPLEYIIDFKGINIADLGGDTYFTCFKDKSVVDIWTLSSKDFTLYHKFSIELLTLPLRVNFCQLIAVCNGKLLLHMNDGTQRLEYYDLETDRFENAAMIARVAYYEKENCRLRMFNEDSNFIVTSFVESLVPLAGSAPKT